MGHETTRRIGRRRITGPRRWSVSGSVATAVALAVLVAVPMVGSDPAGATTSPRLFQAGYRLVSGDGGIFSFSAPYVGSAAADPTACPPNVTTRMMPFGTCWSLATTPSDQGYWVLNAYTGAITSYGDAVSYGDRTASNTGGADLWPTSVAMTPTADGKGYWILNAGLSGFGTVQAFGDAAFYGDQSTIVPQAAPNGTPTGMVATPDAKGYWIVDSDGGVFAFGDAAFLGSMGDRPLNAPVVGMARTPDGGGYWLAGADGGVFAFGDAAFGGSMAATALEAPVIGIVAEPSGAGYWLAGMDGGVFALGGAPFLGSMAGQALNQPVLGISTPAGGLV